MEAATARGFLTMPNAFAFVVLFAWPLVALVLFRALPKAQALIWTILAGYLLLPAQGGLDLPGLPALDKGSIPNVMALLLCLFVTDEVRRARQAGAPAPAGGRGRGLLTGLLVLGAAGGVITVMQNADPVVAGPRFIQGMRPWDAVSFVSGFLILLIPFLLARRYLATAAAHRMLLVALVGALGAYSILMLYEVRMSPQLSNMIYGFFPHSFLQHMRGDGFRPVVFLSHGLWLGILVAMAIVAACALWRDALRAKVPAAPWLFAALWLFLVLVLAKSLGALLLTLLLAPVVLFAGMRMQLLVAGILAAMVLTYPMLRGAGWVPTGAVLAVAERIDTDRAASFRFRIENEDILLARANEKPLGGWGTWGRNRVYDPQTGRDLSVTDGYWVIIIGSYGWLGYLAHFGFLTVPLILLALGRRREDLTPATAGLALVLAVGLVDLIPNATISPVTWLIAGALAGYALRKPAATEEGAETLDVVPRWQAAVSSRPLRPAAAGPVAQNNAPSGQETPRHRRQPRG